MAPLEEVPPGETPTDVQPQSGLVEVAGGNGDALPPSLEGQSPLAGGSGSTTGQVERAAPAVVSTELNANGDSVLDTTAYLGKNFLIMDILCYCFVVYFVLSLGNILYNNCFML